MKKARVLLTTLFVICVLFSQNGYTEDAGAVGQSSMEYLKSVMDMAKEKYKGDISDEKLMEGALKGIFASMDQYTEYYTKEEAETFFNDIHGSYEGIGIMVAKVGEFVEIIKVFPASPAEKAGISSGDKIVEVEGKNMVGASTDEVVSLIKGEAGTKVTIGIVKKGQTKVSKLQVAREQIKINPVTHEIKGDTGYIKLEVFNSNADEYMTKALDEMDKNNIRKIILDLRDNPGGEVGQAVAIARKFVPEGLITKLDFKSEDIKDEEYFSYLKKTKYKLVVLVNKNSASASEILAGAIQDTKAGTLVGTKTFGKAKVQNLLPLLTPEAYKKYEEKLGVKIVAGDDLGKYGIQPTESEIIGWAKITTGLYTTPKGRMIDLEGLKPDISVNDPEISGGVDINSIQKVSKTSKITLKSEGNDVYNAEKILKSLGYDVGTPDMKYDDKTLYQVARFQKDNKLFPYGVLDLTTQKLLNEKLDKLVAEKDKQYAKALELLRK
ncbi:MAG: S41 family peptidase [Clostridia bacterium]|nr:S41 family peptidase [Clostridia bacterium]